MNSVFLHFQALFTLIVLLGSDVQLLEVHLHGIAEFLLAAGVDGHATSERTLYPFADDKHHRLP